jgi:K+-transporting ATPase KdpF subunit
LRQARRGFEVTWMLALASIAAAGLLVYLIAALLYPEQFS